MTFEQHDTVGKRYSGGDYAKANPTWDIEDSPWKARLVAGMLQRHGVEPDSIVEVGCGAGGVLAALRPLLPRTRLRGYDIATDAAAFWPSHAASNIDFRLGHFNVIDNDHYDVLLLLDVLEHVSDPFDFLTRLRRHGDHYVFHVPLDLSAISVLRETPLLHVRHKVGHIHYFTKGLALALLSECGYSVVEASYTGAALSAPSRTWQTTLARLPRRLARLLLGLDRGVRLVGGETLLILARDKGAT
jgi:SAM-dependent methyltransferase